MKKERILKTLLLFSILCAVLSVSFYYDNQTIDNMDIDFQCLQRCQYGTSIPYDSNYSSCVYKEKLDLLPPELLLEMYNISVNERLYNISVIESFDV